MSLFVTIHDSNDITTFWILTIFGENYLKCRKNFVTHLYKLYTICFEDIYYKHTKP